MKEITSEEKLLQLIRKKEKEAHKTDGKTAESNTSPKSAESKLSERFSVDFLTMGNILLGAIIAILVLFALVRMLPQKKEISLAPKKVSAKGNMKEITKPPAAPEARPFDYYSKKIDSRDLFLQPWEKPVSGSSEKPSSAGDLEKQIRVVGIIVDKNPKVVIEDTNTKQTIFVSKGEKVAGAVLVDVSEGQAVFMYNDEKVILTP